MAEITPINSSWIWVCGFHSQHHRVPGAFPWSYKWDHRTSADSEAMLLMGNLVKCLLHKLPRLTAGKECTPEKTFQSCMTTFWNGHSVLKITLQFFWFTWDLQIYSSSHHITPHHITVGLSEDSKHFFNNEEYNCRKKRDFWNSGVAYHFFPRFLCFENAI